MSGTNGARLPRARYMSFPFRMGPDGAAVSNRLDHIREQVEQVLFTSPGERVFRPEFGFGAQRHVFEPNSGPLWAAAQNQLYASLAEALAGEVDPRSIRIEAGAAPGAPEVLLLHISYVIAALQKEESHSFEI